MMTGMARRLDRAHFQGTNADNIVIVQHAKTLLWHWCEPPPKFFHLVAEDARSGFDETRGIEEVRCATRMHVNRGPSPSRAGRFGETPGRSGMVEMNVAEERVAHVRCRKPNLA